MFKKLLIVLLLIFSQTIYANCVCRCMNGEMVPICSNTMEMPPMCPSQMCPMTPPSMKPMDPMTMPPMGTKSCTNQQVLNTYTHQYEWKLICQ